MLTAPRHPHVRFANLKESPIADLNERASHQLAGIERRVVAACTVRGKIGCRRLIAKALLAIAGQVVPLLCWLLFVNTKDSTKTHPAQTKSAPAGCAYACLAGDTAALTRRSHERARTDSPTRPLASSARGQPHPSATARITRLRRGLHLNVRHQSLRTIHNLVMERVSVGRLHLFDNVCHVIR